MSEDKRVLVIPDSHSDPEFSNERYEWLGRLIAEERPPIIVDLGDRCNMHSLSIYDKGSVVAEGRRYKDDLASVHEANELMNRATEEMNNKFTMWKKKKYLPKKVMLTGNHDLRILKAANATPSLYGHLSLDDLKYEESGWSVFPFLTPFVHEDVAFSHYFTSGVMGRPIGGEHTTDSLLTKVKISCVVGHSHLRGFSQVTDGIGRPMCSLEAGCYFEHDEFYTNENHRFWRGLVMLHEVSSGYFDPEFISMKKIKEDYS
jgi:hypothetical protein